MAILIIDQDNGIMSSILIPHLTNVRKAQVYVLTLSMFNRKNYERILSIFSKSEVIINLFDIPIHKKWTKKYKIELYNNRMQSVQQMIQYFKVISTKPQLIIQCSDIGFYPTKGRFREDFAACDENFWSELCYDLETEVQKVVPATRLVIMRLGHVLSRKTEIMKFLLTPIGLNKLSIFIGSKNSSFDWISVCDFCRAIDFFIDNEHTNGIYNLISPSKICVSEFVERTNKNKWFTLTIPIWLSRLFKGDATFLMIPERDLYPEHLIQDNFEFHITSLNLLNDF